MRCSNVGRKPRHRGHRDHPPTRSQVRKDPRVLAHRHLRRLEGGAMLQAHHFGGDPHHHREVPHHFVRSPLQRGDPPIARPGLRRGVEGVRLPDPVLHPRSRAQDHSVMTRSYGLGTVPSSIPSHSNKTNVSTKETTAKFVRLAIKA